MQILYGQILKEQLKNEQFLKNLEKYEKIRIKECIMELSQSHFLDSNPIPKTTTPSEKEMLNWIKNINDENLLSWCGYKSKKDFEDSADVDYSKKTLLDLNWEDLVYMYQHKKEYKIE